MRNRAAVVRGAKWLTALAFALAWLGPAQAAGAASDWFLTDQGRVRLVAAAPSAGDGDSLQLGLDFRLAPHWKIYWRSPGDAGYPPRLDWAGSSNFAGATMAWPAPQRFSVQGLDTIGYTDAVVFPLTARLEQAGTAAHLRLALSYLTCEKICIPYDTVLTLDLPAGPPRAGDTGYAALIARYAARVPRDGDAGLALVAATVIPGKQPVLELRVKAEQLLHAPDAFIEGPEGVTFGAPRLVHSEAPDEALLRLPVFGERPAIERMVGHPVTVTLVDGERSLEAAIAPAAGPPAADFRLLLGVLPLALLGGLILNFMPCVLPVLSIKILGMVEQGGRSRRAVRLGFLATAVQFQQPLFLVGMVALLTLFACNLWGFFEVPLPSALAALGSAGEGRLLLGNFAAGAFATLLATPCSAPFLGTAIGFALAAGPFEIFAIFLALGLGLAAPYLLVALLPRLALWLPRPGHWMLTLRRVLGLALAATALWLVSVLVAQTGAPAALAAGALIAGAAGALLLLRTPMPRRIVPTALLASALLVPALLSVPPTAARADAFWRPFDRAQIEQLVSDGQIVFVDVTADWCLTCKLNEQLVIATPAVSARLSAPDVVAMRADWTRPSTAIAAYLRGFGRYGIPFNAVYGPAAPRGLALSEILTRDQVLGALGTAAGPGRVAGTSK